MPISGATSFITCTSRVAQPVKSASLSNLQIAPKILNFSHATVILRKSNKVTSANAGKFVHLEGKDFYVKNAGARPFASREVIAAEIYHLFAPAPEQFLADHCHFFMENADSQDVYIASKVVDYQDFGDWMAEADSADALKRQYSDFSDESFAAFKCNANEAKELCAELESLRKENPGDWWKSGTNFFLAPEMRTPNRALVDQYRPKASRLDTIMKEQFSLLPEQHRKEMQVHLAVSQLIGDWDPINAFYRNMGMVTEATGAQHVMRLDFGSCFDVGFNYEPKETGFQTAINQRPAVFPELVHAFAEKNAVFSKKLPQLVEELDQLPYADYAKSIAGKTEWAKSTRFQIAYRCALLKRQAHNQNVIGDIIRRVLIDEAELGPGLKTKEVLVETMNARIDALINEQCGGNDRIYDWERQNPELSYSIREDLSSKLAVDLQPLNNALWTHPVSRKIGSEIHQNRSGGDLFF